jgi:SAM-dependent methyltransferase
MLQLSEIAYLRERVDPKPGDEFYLPLSDLLAALRQLTPFDAGCVLDYGCGGSPYRQLFSGAYIGADIASNPKRDVTLDDGSRLPDDLRGIDLVFSTQVLEHVEDPDQYLRECWRVLADQGTLVLSTHGMFEDHGSPNDYWRWTAEGLRKLIGSHGFAVEEIIKVTCGPRAAMFTLERDLRLMGAGRKVSQIFPTLFAVMRRLNSRRRHQFADIQYDKFRVCDASSPHSPGRYVGIVVRARKRADN